jgi:NAD(P)H-dependent flavin oxidoreductase YrpB (nitropropane dioxygenase family)
MRTILCDILGIEVPIIQAPMGGAAGPRLASAVSNAGGLGTLPLSWQDSTELRAAIHETKTLTEKPFAVNLILDFPQEERLETCLQERVPVISFFWRVDAQMVSRAKAGGAIVMQTVGSVEEAQTAVRFGVDIIVAQGWEAGGHVRGDVTTMALVPTVVDAVGSVPVVAAGGIADGRGLAAALALGAVGAWIGTRFLMSPEATIHRHYRERLIQAAEGDTVYLKDLFDIGWPDAPHRVLRNKTVDNWEAAGRPETGKRPGEGDTIATSKSIGPLVRYGCETLSEDIEGDIDAISLWAGQSVGLVKKLQPAADIVREINNEASKILKRLVTVSG